ncbi:DnaD domain-containing protein [Sporolactobacillus kofuensis]|uniref:DnaD domain-containing protein n=1 Tax=Sporolactobacillus kofuensis TaxID=269672 RepID=A0ABW1WIK0_9BACL|nr:DnaD domain-containing protein [Sporolactobacillus kofuensis]MCO7176174.1 DnaD domain-containing protein [Sporolactobacillus kofuensis]
MEMKFLINLIESGSISVPSILLDYYNQLGLNEQECMMLIHVHAFLSKGDDFPTFDNLAARMTLDETECAELLRRLIQRGYLSIIQKNDNNIYSEAYSLQPLWEKLLRTSYSQVVESSSKSNDEALYTLFETEFGRPLSPIECETLAMWIDQDRHSPKLIKGALREAVISGKLNFRYIDRILFEWKKNGIKTLDQAKQHGDKIRNHQPRTSTSSHKQQNISEMPSYNWLDK